MHGLKTLEKLNQENVGAVSILSKKLAEAEAEVKKLKSIVKLYDNVNEENRHLRYLLDQINSISDLKGKGL